MEQKILNNLGFIGKSKKFVVGDRLLDYIRANKVFYVILAKDMGESQKKKFSDKCKFYQIEYIDDLFNSEILNKYLNTINIKAIGITDLNLAKLLQNNL